MATFMASGRRTAAPAAVPWRDWREWQQVHAALFSADAGERQRGISRVAAWRSRAQLPVAINATAQLAELQLHEELAEHHHHAVGVGSRSHMELSLLLASVVVRCVNGLVDASQTGAYAMPVSALAQRIGIPLWIVDLRHESTHNQLPSLPVLRFAAQHLLAWLRTNYWAKQDDEIRALVHRAASWLFSQPPLGSPPDAEAAQPPPPCPDGDCVRSVAVSLLVSGEQFGERVAPTGLLFLPGSEDGASSTIDKFVPVLLDLQAQWSRFSAYLLAGIGKKFFDTLLQLQELEEDESGEARALLEQELTTTTQWIDFLTGRPWRERLKATPAVIDDIYSCGAELLLAASSLRARNDEDASTPILSKLIGIMRACSGVNNLPIVASESSVRASIDALPSDFTWSALSGWTACPIGLQYSYDADWVGGPSLEEYSLDDDSILPPHGTAFVSSGEDDVDDEVIDSLMKENDEEYDLALQKIAELQAKIGQDHQSASSLASHLVIPKQELQRIQDEIEIW